MRNNFSKTFKRSVTAVAVSVSLGLAMPAMANDGLLVGKSLSNSGNAISGVSVTIVNIDTGLTRTITTDSQGNYKFPLLPSGNYSLEAKKNGFLMVKQDKLKVSSVGRTSADLTLESGNVERISVTGANISAIDVSSSESQLVVDLEYLAKVPVARDVTSVALLAPGTVSGDSDFGKNASFGGSSVGENTYYINGINTTNFRNGLGGSELPFEMYKTFEVKTGGYSAEFGRSTGGVVNATTRSGSNEFKFGASAFWEPSSMRASSPDVKRTDADNIEEAGSEYYEVNSEDKTGTTNYNLWASGALIQDKLFFFGLVNQEKRDRDYATFSNFYEREASDTLFAAKIDWYITDEHILEFTGWDNGSDLDTNKRQYSHDTKTKSRNLGDFIQERGGKTWGLKYTGILTDDLQISAQYSINEASYSNLNAGENPLGDKPAIYERFSGKEFGGFGLFTPSIQNDKRTAYRFDVDWYVHDDHKLRFGIDYEEMEATEDTQRAGGVAYRYQGCDTAELANDVLDCTTVRQEFYVNQGDFETKSAAFYIEDNWQVTDDLTARIGLRNESFENYNKAGDKFVDVANQWAPRLGLSWDINGDGESKVYANYGRYFLPVATNTNVRLAGDELYTRQVFDVESINADFTPNFVVGSGGAISTFADGQLKDTKETVNANLDPMYQDEFMLGYEQVINDSWSFGVKATYRDLGSSLEDVAIDKGFDDSLDGACTLCSGFHYYVLTNPGEDVTITTDPDGDGPLELKDYTITADQLGYPEAKRQYAAVDLTLNRAWDDLWLLNVTYTWSHSWGNNEGFVRSDNDQDDSGLTTNFDQPGLTDGATGNLPNDRRHNLKINGAYAITEDLSVGANLNFTTGRPLNSFGFHPTDAFASLYQAESFVKEGQLVTRGSEGRTSNTWTLDLSATYDYYIEDSKITFRADIFNVTNNDKVTQQNETNERYSSYDGAFGGYRGEANPTYGLPTNFQQPRYVRISVSAEF
ncbi:TonB-dependent receptor [Colwellia sp. MB02u-18]|uniref:TonB-dependent receptor n=1 Tax=unclassified Colwellia TaxID=196834 RepID=UPI0015F5F5B6|nr:MULTISPECIES: TonB-dependent receptor [unclassified Colwellia]MBA6224263.1 TonB-dependent receptor [Colwellia sp. MB3u-45]MBA6265905.1 TonB-dependent receptor [Colwellia sp. MB3u-43]MBA6321585.1 TonB-dependent receptor [Colwellia sp. MB02u-19]MBA6323647.1 TonB-dependent receptor [Colwellia sp. MB02u-18]MBA6331182.1 TonB-dependent receptor [Colwellia sp. MB02u-12]